MSALAAGAGLEAALWQLYRKYYDSAEATRRWSLSDDIPWKDARPLASADFVEMVGGDAAEELAVRRAGDADQAVVDRARRAQPGATGSSRRRRRTSSS